MEHFFQLVIVGGGPAGYEAAIRAAQLGLSTALVENRELGGTCLNRGCIPTKAILHSAEAYREAAHFEELGLSASGVSFDYNAITARKNRVVEQLRNGIEQLVNANKITLFRGTGVVTGPGAVRASAPGAEDVKLRAEHILIAVGSVPARPPIPGSDLPDVVTSDELLGENAKWYKRLLIIGGGVIGCEFAAAFSAFGCEVTIAEALPRILPPMDREVSQNLSMILKKRGVAIHTAATVEKIEAGSPLACTFTEKGTSQAVEADGILIATGRRPNTSNLFAPGFTPETEHGYITVNKRFETSLKNVYAVGDAIRGMQLAHSASAQGIAAAEFLAGKTPSVNLAAIPACVYTSPEIATVGITADEAKERGIAVKTGKSLTSMNARSLIAGEERGFAKLVFGADTGALLGAQLMCARATDLIAELTLAVAQGLTVRQLADAVRAHPTFAEIVTEAAEDALGGAIHSLPKRNG